MKNKMITDLNCELRDDWCHLCGFRRKGLFVTFDMPYNAENNIAEPARYVRLCEFCVAKMRSVLKREETETVGYHIG